MSKVPACSYFIPTTIESTLSEIAVTESEQTFEAVKTIWRERLERSHLFLPSEIDVILPIWIKFIYNRIQRLPTTDAEQFYVETAELAAQKLKHFAEHGWECLNLEFTVENLRCSDDSLQRSEEHLQDQAPSKDGGKESTAPSSESSSDILAQVDYLFQLVVSSDFNLSLVRTALDPTFVPNYIELKTPHTFQLPKKYLEFEPDEEDDKEQIRKNLINGEFDTYILPLQIANEINSDFWDQMEREVMAEQRSTSSIF